MWTKLFFAVLAAGTVFSVHSVSAQDTKVARVGIIMQGGPWYTVVDELREGFRELGLVEGKQLILDIRDTQGDLKAVEEAAKNLEQQKVNVIYTIATSVSVVAKRATHNIPIIFFVGSNPVTVDLVDSIVAPGGRLSGVYSRTTELTGKRLELLREIVPNLHRVMTFYDPRNPSASLAAKEGREAARALGLEFVERQVASVKEFEKALQTFKTGDADAYFAVSDAMIDSQTEAIIEMATAKKLPTMFYQPVAVIKGGLATYSWDYGEIGRLSAKYIQRILEGAKPSNLPVEGVDKYKFLINTKTAKQIGLAIPEPILIRADKVIE